MKILKKALSVFLAVLMLLTAMSASLVAFAADSNTSALYRSLAYSFFNYTTASSGMTTVNVVNTDDNGYPIASIVGSMDQYTVTNESGEYEYADDLGNPIRAVEYTHKVTAKDNSNGVIRGAALNFLSIADNIMSRTYGVGNYTVPMIIDAVSKELEFFKGDDGQYLFLDGYTYYVDGLGQLVTRSPEKTYEVVDGEIVYFETEEEEEDVSIRDILQNGDIDAMTLFDYCNVSTVIQYFSGNCTDVNSGNWFHEFVFECATDVDTVLTTESFNTRPITERKLTVTWSMRRQFDDSGTKPQYYNGGYISDSSGTATNTIRSQLSTIRNAFSTYFSTYYADGVLKNKTNSELLSTDYANITRHAAVYNSLSDAAKLAVFGADAYSYANLLTQLTPIVDLADIDRYLPSHTYERYFDNLGNNVEYNVTTDKITTIVSTIDDLLKSEKVGDIIKTFIDFSDPQYEGMAFYGVEANTPQEILVQVIQNFVFNDNIINTLLGFLYPMITNLLDENITNDFISGALGSLPVPGIAGIISAVVHDGDGWMALVYGALAANTGTCLTPAGVAFVWNKYGYMTTSDTSFNNMIRANHDILRAANGGVESVSGGAYTTPGYNAIGTEFSDNYLGERWRDVDFDSLYWGINGDRQKFQSALGAILAPISALLCVLLGRQRSEIQLGSVVYLILENIDLYDDVLLPLLEALQIPNLCSPSRFRTLAAGIVSDRNRNKTTIENFLNGGLLTPLLDWVMDVVLADPISTVINILPNVSYYLTSGALFNTIANLSIPINARILGINATLYTLNVRDLLGDALNFLDSLQGILDLIGINVDTGIPIVGYYAEGSTTVYTPSMTGYNASTMTIPVAEAYKSPGSGSNTPMSTYRDGEYSELVTGLNADGTPNENALYNNIGWANASGFVVLARNDTTAPATVYNREVTHYYEYSITDTETGESILRRTTFLPEGQTDYTYVYETINQTASAKIPAIMDYKLQATGNITEGTSLREDQLTITDGTGNWAAGRMKYITLNINGVDTRGLVLLFVFRYLFSALEYRHYQDGNFTSDYTLLDAFGIGDLLERDLFYGLKLQDIINNISLHPDGAIASLYELFYKNEFGSIYEVVNGVVEMVNRDYTYDIDNIDFHTDEILGYAEEYNDYTYGTSVVYTDYWTADNSKYVMDNIDGLVDNIFTMIKLQDVESIGALLEGLVNQYLFNNEMLSTIATFLYKALDSIDVVDLATILNAALDVDYSKTAIRDALYYVFDGTTNGAQRALNAQFRNGVTEYNDNTFYNNTENIETGEMTATAVDWGYDDPAITAKYSSSEIFMRNISAILSPFSILFEFLLCGEDLSILNLLHLPGYEGYYFAWTPLMEALDTGGLISFESYYSRVFNGVSETAQNCDAIYYALLPILSLVEKVIADPVSTLLGIIPNVAFFVSIGGLNGVINNLLHFVYVLLDIIQPVFDAYPLINGFLGNIRIGDFVLNISVPLDFDFNQLVNTLLSGLLGEALSFDIVNNNLPIGTRDTQQALTEPVIDPETGEQAMDENGVLLVQPVLDANGNQAYETVTETVYATGTLNITLPYIDLSTLCAGTIQERTSASGQRYIYLNSSGGADLITLVLRIVMETLFYRDNAVNIAEFLTGYCQLDDAENNDDLIMEIFTYLNDKALGYELPDRMMGLIFTIYTYLVPIADGLGGRFAKVDFSIIDMFNDMDNIQNYISALLNAGSNDPSEPLTGVSGIFKKLINFFKKIIDFFKSLFA